MKYRFHKGDRVEVSSQGEVSSGSWRYGIIESGNGHTYYIHYESSDRTVGGPVVQRVPRKSIRPCPPVEVVESWAAGNFVEVFDNSSWKFGEILKAKDVDLFLVRLLGTSQKVEARKSCLRLPKSWQDEEWVEIQKVSRDVENRNLDHQSTKRAHHKSLDKDSKMRSARNDNYPTECEAGFQMSDMACPRTFKRSLPYNPTRGAGQKLRAIEKDGKPQRRLPEHAMHASTKNRDTGLSEMDQRVRNGSTKFEPNDAERSACSVGSSDTSSKEETVDEADQLALNAYYHTMESLRALGYLTWEQEEMITDLRLKLSISNDQHLMELRKLVSAQ